MSLNKSLVTSLKIPSLYSHFKPKENFKKEEFKKLTRKITKIKKNFNLEEEKDEDVYEYEEEEEEEEEELEEEKKNDKVVIQI